MAKGDIGENTVRYLSHAEATKLLHVPRTMPYNHMMAGGTWLTPDLLILPETYGYDEDRVLEYGEAVGLITSQGRPRPDDKREPILMGRDIEAQMTVRLRFSEATSHYLGSAAASHAMGLGDTAVYLRRRRGNFIPADVQVGSRVGWDEDRILEFGRQNGLADPDILRAWAVRRTRDYGLAPAPWVKELAKTSPDLTKEIAKAKRKYKRDVAAGKTPGTT